MKLLIQQFLQDHSLDDLEALGIKYKKHPKDSRVLFVYDQIESNPSSEIVRECRGLILDSANNWKIVACPLFRFPNWGEGWCQEFDWNSASFIEKLDGTMVTLSYFHNQWHFSTKGSPDAGGSVGLLALTFQELIQLTWRKEHYSFPEETDYTFVFELTSLENRIVIPYPERHLTLLMVRNNLTLQEEDPQIYATKYRFRLPQTYPIGTIEDAVKALAHASGLAGEGYVVRDKFYRRLKVKSPAYVSLAHLKESLTNKNILNLIRIGEDPEFLTYFPEYEGIFYETRLKYQRLLRETEATYLGLKDLVAQKEFALEAVKHPYSGCLFQMRKGQTMGEFYQKLPIDRLMQLLEKI